MSAKMKITAGLGTLEQYDAYVEAGADELFCVGRRKGYRGYHPEEKAPCEE